MFCCSILLFCVAYFRTLDHAFSNFNLGNSACCMRLFAFLTPCMLQYSHAFGSMYSHFLLAVFSTLSILVRN
ncbi:hypothetical protein DUNSADRAFT_13023 [Dunaliella salina]|uniref:Secreted peptide n=1 Tax=Dunaliella salina TaxID=3046 RepID=A0ABQ7GA82_DUNSA|nr:hypothetical protein DUNSADRAFT_13023 [Dunaliella salina]|eukprot:KAF5831519.1 hypothetical protein DUNSADRAFT_13023 [Dunaliella salina]